MPRIEGFITVSLRVQKRSKELDSLIGELEQIVFKWTKANEVIFSDWPRHFLWNSLGI